MSGNDSKPSDARFEREILQDISEIKSDVAGLNRDISNIRYLYERLETSFIKLDSATGKIDTMLSIQEKTLSNIDRMIRERDEKQNKDFQEIKSNITERFGREETDRKTERKETNDRIADANKLITTGAEKIAGLERFRWIVYGALVIIAFAAPYIQKLIAAAAG